MTEFDRRLMLGAAGIAGAAAFARLAHAGPLTPPAGAVASTGKPLAEIEPRTAVNAANTPGTATAVFRITAPGSYYLTANIAGVSGKSGIEIAASDVTLDLGGFRLLGAAGTLAGIAVSGTQSGVAIRRGTIRSWAGGGISASTCTDATIEDVHALSNTGHGISVGSGAVVARCVCASNTQSGILASVPAMISHCLARANGSSGITTGDHSIVSDCIATGNTSNGLVVGAGTIIKDCVTAQNNLGVSASSGLNAVNVIARDNNSDGFFCFGASYTNCLSTANTGHGFNTDAAMFTGCRSTGNGAEGFSMGNNSLATHSIAVGNGAFGFHADSGYVLHNLSSGNCTTSTELREIKLNLRGRIDGNHLMTTNSSLWGMGGGSAALMIHNSINGGFVTTFGGTEGPDITGSNITTDMNSGNYNL